MDNKDQARFGVFDYNLTPDEEKRAADLHRTSIVIDMLYWGPSTKLSLTKEMEQELLDTLRATGDVDVVTLQGIYQAQRMSSKGNFPRFMTL